MDLDKMSQAVSAGVQTSVAPNLPGPGFPKCSLCHAHISGGLICGISCDHFYCVPCIVERVKSANNKADLVSLKHGNLSCPACSPDCSDGGISLHVLEAILPKEDLTALQQAAVQVPGLEVYYHEDGDCQEQFEAPLGCDDPPAAASAPPMEDAIAHASENGYYTSGSSENAENNDANENDTLCALCVDRIPHCIIADISGEHFFCKSCILSYAREAERKNEPLNGPDGNLRCPSCWASNKEGGIAWGDLKVALGEADMKLLSMMAVQSAGIEVFQCITPGCGEVFTIDPLDFGLLITACSRCAQEQCLRCRCPMDIHDIDECLARHSSQGTADSFYAFQIPEEPVNCPMCMTQMEMDGDCITCPSCGLAEPRPPVRFTTEPKATRREDEKLPECKICFEDITGKYVIGESCDHFFCTDCISNYITKAESKSALISQWHGNVRCPECPPTEENGGIQWGDLREILKPIDFEHLQLAIVQGAGVEMYHCITEGCAEQFDIMPSSDGKYIVLCPKCEVDQCPKCQKPAAGHDGKFCNEMGLKADPKSLALMQQTGVVKCPKCGMGAEKSSGCNFMTCGQCRSHYCYLCSTTLTADEHYTHWDTLPTPCKGHLFTDRAKWLEGNQDASTSLVA